MSYSNNEIIQHLGADTDLWCPSKNKTAKPAEVIGNKVVFLYCSAHWCPPCRQFTPAFAETYKKLKARSDVEDFDVVFCSMDKTEPQYKEYASEMPWWSMPFNAPELKKIFSIYEAEGIPHLVIIDKDGKVISTDGVMSAMKDKEGENFPWRPKPLGELFPNEYISDDKKTRKPMKELDDKYLMLYFSAHWCPPCRGFTPKLSKAYKTLKKYHSDFELLFLSSDRDQYSFDEYFKEMSFCAIPYEERKAKEELAQRLGIKGIPSLFMFGPKPADGGDRPLINKNVRGCIESDDFVSEFPFVPKPYGHIDRGSADVNSCRCVVVFHEGGDDSEHEDLQDALKTAAEGSDDKSMRFFWATTPGGFGERIREALKLGPVKDTPTMVLLDLPDEGGYYMSKETNDITAETIAAFIKSPGTRMQI